MVSILAPRLRKEGSIALHPNKMYTAIEVYRVQAIHVIKNSRRNYKLLLKRDEVWVL